METTARQRILAVDDDPVIRQILHSVLSKDYELVLLSSGENIRPLLEGIDPDLVILDVSMPAITGFDLCRSIRSMDAYMDLPIIFLSGHYEDRDVLQGVRSGADYYMAKPFHSHELRRVVNACLNGKIRALYKTVNVRGF